MSARAQDLHDRLQVCAIDVSARADHLSRAQNHLNRSFRQASGRAGHYPSLRHRTMRSNKTGGVRTRRTC